MTEALPNKESGREENLRSLTSVEKKRMEVILMMRAGRFTQDDQLRWIIEDGNSAKFRKFIENSANRLLVLECLGSANPSLWERKDNREDFLAYLGSVNVLLLEEIERRYKNFSIQD